MNKDYFALLVYPDANNSDVFKRRAIRQTILGGFYFEWLDYNGLFLSGATKECSKITLDCIRWDLDNGYARFSYTPFSNYHCWHICMCDRCAKLGGRFFTHSQGSFDDHLRFVSPDSLFTFPTVGIGTWSIDVNHCYAKV